MKLFNKQLLLFVRGHCGGEPAGFYTIAGWHWNWSITWRWVLHWYPPNAERNRLKKLTWWQKIKKSTIGSFIFATQKNMRYNPDNTPKI
jgi:hypothetical protein